jgi:hypothetical protein
MEAADVVEEIDESRRLGIEEPIGRALFPNGTIRVSEPKSLGTVRRRPPTNVAALAVVRSLDWNWMICRSLGVRSRGLDIGGEILA